MLARLTLLAAIAVAATAVALPSLAPAATKPIVLAYTVKDGKVVRGNKRPSVKKGKLVKIVVVANKGKELHLHGYDIERVIRPNKQTVIQFTAKIPGRFEIEMHEPDILVAQLSVKP